MRYCCCVGNQTTGQPCANCPARKTRLPAGEQLDVQPTPAGQLDRSGLLELIARQQAKIQRLEKLNEALKEGEADMLEAWSEQKAVINRLKAKLEER